MKIQEAVVFGVSGINKTIYLRLNIIARCCSGKSTMHSEINADLHVTANNL
jgi:hypothetical protein